MTLSVRAKEAIKTALAMVLAYGIALWMDWDRPYWAAIAVAFVSLATIGQSFNKAALRMFGTLLGAVVALVLIALFPQDRWWFMVFFSAWVGFCTYMMGGARHQYFWHVAGFVSAVIAIDAGPDSANAFQTATIRFQETGLGILVYSLVTLFLWPINSRAQFHAAAAELVSTQHKLFRAYLGLMKREGSADEAQGLMAQLIQGQTGLDQLLDAAESDDYEVWELRQPWRRFRVDAAALTDAMARWHEGFVELQRLDMERLLPNMAEFGAELDTRFAAIERMLADQPPEHSPREIDLTPDAAEAQSLSQFEAAAVAVNRSRLERLDSLTRSLFDAVGDIKAYGRARGEATVVTAPSHGFVPDLDRLTATFRVMSGLWLAYLAWIYVDGIPAGPKLVILAVAIGMVLATMPQLSVSLLFAPLLGSTLFAGAVYMFVMPKLSSFVELGLLIFVLTFGIGYLFAAPKQMLGKAFGLVLFFVVTGISNDQTYSFLSWANTAMMFALFMLLAVITSYIPFSPRPQHAFLRLLGRFFQSSEYLVSTAHRDAQRPMSRLDRWRRAFHLREVSTLPRKLGAWARFVDGKALGGITAEQVQAAIACLQALAYRLQELVEAREHRQAKPLVQALSSDIGDWRLKGVEVFQSLAADPGAGKDGVLQSRLDERLARVEQRVREALDRAPDGELSDQESQDFYRLLNAYRGVSEAVVGYAGVAGRIDWSRWREDRF
jgi:uncharacterized membrane protein YccC